MFVSFRVAARWLRSHETGRLPCGKHTASKWEVISLRHRGYRAYQFALSLTLDIVTAMAELTVSNLPLSENFCQQQTGNTPYGASEQGWPLTSPVDFIAITGPCAQTLLGTIP